MSMDSTQSPQPLDVRFMRGNFGAARYGPKGVYLLPEDRTITGKARSRARMTFFLGFFMTMWAATEVLAARLHFDAALGAPMFMRIYAPWNIFGWATMLLQLHFRSRAYSHQVASALVVSAIVLIAGAVISNIVCKRAYTHALRNAPRPPDLRGSAHWASPQDLQRMKLLPEDLR
jgi:type IV secretory pathway TraG/TraD family ATPase VirD4